MQHHLSISKSDGERDILVKIGGQLPLSISVCLVSVPVKLRGEQ